MSPRWGFKTFGYPVGYKHAAPLGLNTSTFSASLRLCRFALNCLFIRVDSRRFAAFTYSHSQLKDVITYIKNQEIHHSHKTFKEEYLELLKRFDVPYNPKYVFDSEDTPEV